MARVVKKPEERRLEIVTQAQKLFLENEYDATTLNEVVSSLGIAKGTVYHYFKSKEELLDGVVSKMAGEYLSMVQAKLGSVPGSALEKMNCLVKAMDVSSHWDATLQQLHRPGNACLHVRLLGLLVRGLSPLLSNIIEQGCDEKVFKVIHPLESAEFLLAGFQFITDLGIFPWEQEELKRRQQSFAAIAEAQLGATPGSLSFLTTDD